MSADSELEAAASNAEAMRSAFLLQIDRMQADMAQVLTENHKRQLEIEERCQNLQAEQNATKKHLDAAVAQLKATKTELEGAQAQREATQAQLLVAQEQVEETMIENDALRLSLGHHDRETSETQQQTAQAKLDLAKLREAEELMALEALKIVQEIHDQIRTPFSKYASVSAAQDAFEMRRRRVLGLPADQDVNMEGRTMILETDGHEQVATSSIKHTKPYNGSSTSPGPGDRLTASLGHSSPSPGHITRVPLSQTQNDLRLHAESLLKQVREATAQRDDAQWEIRRLQDNVEQLRLKLGVALEEVGRMQRLLQEQEKERETRSRPGGRGEEEGGGDGECPVETVTRGEFTLDLFLLEKVTRECQDARRQKKTLSKVVMRCLRANPL